MSYFHVITLNIFAAILTLTTAESIFNLSLLVLSVVLTGIKCVEMVINIRIKKAELKKLGEEKEEH